MSVFHQLPTLSFFNGMKLFIALLFRKEFAAPGTASPVAMKRCFFVIFVLFYAVERLWGAQRHESFYAHI